MLDTTQTFEFWRVPTLWPGESVFIIGGGPSLKGFDFSLLYRKNVIGCNDAYQLGSWVDVCLFGDLEWYTGRPARAADPRTNTPAMPLHVGHREGLKSFDGLKVVVNSKFLVLQQQGQVESDLKVINRAAVGFYTGPGYCAWNKNCGACAINLAYLMGAKRVVLLGFDMCNENDEDGKSNWHPNHKDYVRNDHYAKDFFRKFTFMVAEMKRKGVRLEVMNATPNSKLPHFPIVALDDVL